MCPCLLQSNANFWLCLFIQCSGPSSVRVRLCMCIQRSLSTQLGRALVCVRVCACVCVWAVNFGTRRVCRVISVWPADRLDECDSFNCRRLVRLMEHLNTRGGKEVEWAPLACLPGYSGIICTGHWGLDHRVYKPWHEAGGEAALKGMPLYWTVHRPASAAVCPLN